MEIPEQIVEKLKAVAQRSGLSYNEVLAEYEKQYQNEELFKRIGLEDPMDRHSFVLRSVIARLLAETQGEQYIIMPFGLSPLRYSQEKGYWYRFMYAYKLKDVDGKLKPDKHIRIYLTGRAAESTKGGDKLLFRIYKTYLNPIAEDFYMSVNRTTFNSPKPSKIQPLMLFEKLLKVPRITIAQAVKFPSRIGEDGYPVEGDWRLIEGTVARSAVTISDTRELGIYEIVDESVVDEIVTKDGVTLSRMTVFTAAEFAKYAEPSILYFIGTVGLDNTGIPMMTAICVLPKYAIVREDIEL